MQNTLPSSILGFLLLSPLVAVAACVITPDDSPEGLPLCSRCDPAMPLRASDITRLSETVNGTVDGQFVSGTCGTLDELLAVSCSSSALSDGLGLVAAGVESSSTSKCGWDWNNTRLDSVDLISTSICLEWTSPPDGPWDCSCPRIERFTDRVYRMQRSQGVPGGSHQSISATCLEDVLIGGGCSIEPDVPLTSTLDFFITQSGLAESASEWSCGASNAGQGSYTLTATAVCVRPISPETAADIEPLAGRIVLASQTAMLPANNLLAFSAACEPGDFLLAGSCTLDSAEPSTAEIVLVHHGLEPEDNNLEAWRCAWNNPTDATPTARATAMCLKPSAL